MLCWAPTCFSKEKPRLQTASWHCCPAPSSLEHSDAFPEAQPLQLSWPFASTTRRPRPSQVASGNHLQQALPPEFFLQLLGWLSQRAMRGREVWSHLVHLERGDLAALENWFGLVLTPDLSQIICIVSIRYIQQLFLLRLFAVVFRFIVLADLQLCSLGWPPLSDVSFLCLSLIKITGI